MKALIITGPMAQDAEVIYPMYRMQEAGLEVDVAVKGCLPCKGIQGMDIKPTRDLPINSEVYDYELLVLPGGVKCMESLRQDVQILAFINHYHRTGGVIGSICSGAQLLISAGLVKGRTISAYPAMCIDVENAGGEWHPGPVVKFDRIVSSPHYRNLPEFMKLLLQSIGEERAWRQEVYCAAR